MSIRGFKWATKPVQPQRTYGRPTEGSTFHHLCYKHCPPTEGGASNQTYYKHCPPTEGRKK